MKAFIPTVAKYTQAQLDAGQANSDKAQFIIVVDGSGVPVVPQKVYFGTGNNTLPSTIATAASVQTAVSAVVINDWQANTVVALNEVKKATVAVGSVRVGDLLRSTAARTTGAAFDATEATFWTDTDVNLVTSVAGRTGAIVLAEGDVANLTTDLAAKAPLASPTFTGTVGGITKTMVGLGSVNDTADTAKPVSTAQQTALNLKVDISTNTTDMALKMGLYQQGHPFHTSATQAGHIVTGSSQYAAQYAPWTAFQTSPGSLNEWATASAAAASLTYELPQATIFNRVVLMGRLSGAEYPTVWSLAGSNDGTTFTDLIVSHTESLQAEVTKDFTNTVAYKFYKFAYTVGIGSNIGLNHIRFFHSGINYLPTLPVQAQANSDWNSVSGVSQILNKPSTMTPTAHTHAESDITNLATDLANKQNTLTAQQTNSLGAIQATSTRDVPTFTAATTAGTLGNYIASASSEFSSGTYPAWAAIRNVSTGGTASQEWATNSQSTNQWIQVQYPQAKIVTRIIVRSRTASADMIVAGWKLQGSNNGTTFTDLYTSATAMTDAEVAHTIPNTTAYLYYRILGSGATAGQNIGLKAFWLYEDQFSIPTVSV